MEQRQSNTKVAGIDVAKRKLDVAILGQPEPLEVANTPAGHTLLIGWLRDRSVIRVGLEASGGYERGVREALAAAGLQVVVHQPQEVRLFARLKRIRAKNDRIDAQVIALATAQVEALRAAQDPALARLAERLTAYEHFAETLARAKTFREHLRLDDLKAELDSQIAGLKALKRRLARELIQAIRDLPDLARRFDLVQSLPGVGPITAATLVVRMPELGALKHGQAASLLGVAPFDRDSGTLKGKRFIWGGRSRPRRFVYLAALAARRCDPAHKAFANRLAANGKPPKVILVAIMRKLIEAANLILARGYPWTPTPA